jgi:hypothetical protein
MTMIQSGAIVLEPVISSVPAASDRKLFSIASFREDPKTNMSVQQLVMINFSQPSI